MIASRKYVVTTFTAQVVAETPFYTVIADAKGLETNGTDVVR
jgi:hypothetical protein